MQYAVGDATGAYITNFADLTTRCIASGNGDATTNYVDVGGATNMPSQIY